MFAECFSRKKKGTDGYRAALLQLANPFAPLDLPKPETFAHDAANLYNDWVLIGHDLTRAARRYRAEQPKEEATSR